MPCGSAISCPRAISLYCAIPASYGQRLPNGQGIPIQVTADSDLFTELRMRRMGAITGNITAEERVDIRATGAVTGDIVSPRLAVAEGGCLRGKVEMPARGRTARP